MCEGAVLDSPENWKKGAEAHSEAHSNKTEGHDNAIRWEKHLSALI